MDDEQNACSHLETILRDPNAEPTNLPFSVFESITRGFSEDLKIGKGGFAVVYKGVLPNHRQLVAVKKLESTQIDDNSFLNEVSCLLSCKHKNIVRFLGYCSNKSEKLTRFEGKFVIAEVQKSQKRVLCFEFMRNGSLQNHITDEFSGLAWLECYRIIKGVCQGILYLHEKQITHLDLKPENILLDQNMVPKISDFGISRLFENEQTRHITSNIVGTRGYMAPEYLFNGIISSKADIYSLGVIILEVVTGKRTGPNIENVLENWKDRLRTTSSIWQLEACCKQINICLEITLKCMSFNKDERPTIVEIIDMLNRTETGFQENETVISTELQEFPPVEPMRQIASMLDNTETGYQESEVISTVEFGKLASIDVHPTQSWIVTGHFKGQVCIWNYKTKELVKSIEVAAKEVLSVKFIVEKQWVVAGGSDYWIHVYSENELKEVYKFKAHHEQITTLSIHPTEPYVLSACYDFEIKLWNWQNGWKPAQIFEEHSNSMRQVAFNAKDGKVFGSVAKDMTLKVWSLDSPVSKLTLTGHTSDVRCLEFFSSGDKEYIITGSADCTAKIWDLQEERCVETLEGHSDSVIALCCHPELPILMTGSRDGTVRLWNSGTFQLEGVLDFHLREVRALACMKSSKRIVIGYTKGLAIAIIDGQGYSNELAA